MAQTLTHAILFVQNMVYHLYILVCVNSHSKSCRGRFCYQQPEQSERVFWLMSNYCKQLYSHEGWPFQLTFTGKSDYVSHLILPHFASSIYRSKIQEFLSHMGNNPPPPKKKLQKNENLKVDAHNFGLWVKDYSLKAPVYVGWVRSFGTFL